MNNKLNKTLDSFLGNKKTNKNLAIGYREECDIKTGECYTIKTKDGIVERLNKRFITEDGRQLLQD